jgi:hypothetical protein
MPEPVAEPFDIDDPTVTPWAEAWRRLAEARTYWLATVRPDGRPHAVPILAVAIDDVIHFVASPGSLKGRDLARDRRCVLTTDGTILHLVVEGIAARVTDEARLRRVAEEYVSKYEWPVEIRDGFFYGDGAPTAGPPPYAVFEVRPSTIFGFPAAEDLRPTRWRF